MKPKMYLMTGKPGAGKSTFAKGFCEQFNLWHLDVDEFYKIYNGGQRHEHSFEVWITMFNAIHTAGREGRDILIDTNAENHEDRYQFLQWFPEFDHFLIWIDTPDEVCLRQNQMRDRIIPAERMKELLEDFRAPVESIENSIGKQKWLGCTRVDMNGEVHNEW